MTPDLQAIRKRWQKATPGPWGWFGNVGHGKDMSTNIRLSSRRTGDAVMMFRRVQKTNAAQPFFQHLDPSKGIMVPARNFIQHEQPYRTHIKGIQHPDAEAIAAAPEDIRVLLEVADNLYASALAHRELLNSALTALQNIGTPEALEEVQAIQDLARMLFVPATPEDL